MSLDKTKDNPLIRSSATRQRRHKINTTVFNYSPLQLQFRQLYLQFTEE